MRPTLVLSPSPMLAQPRGWASLSPEPLPAFEEVHLIGGGSLLLWLLAKAGRAPRASKIVCHGPPVLPTPESCWAWLGPEPRVDVSVYEWSQQALSVGIAGSLRATGHAWLEPWLRHVATGRLDALTDDFEVMQTRWERSGRLMYAPTPAPMTAAEDDADLLLTNMAALVRGGSANGRPRGDFVLCSEDTCQLRYGSAALE